VSGNDGTVWYLRIQEDALSEALLLRLEGRVFNATTRDLAHALDQFCTGNRRALVLDLSAVDYINGQGLSLVQSTAERLRMEHRELVVFGLCPVVETAFDLSGALAQVMVERSRDAALTRVGVGGGDGGDGGNG
jgi:anti-anti-sigma factor